MLMMPRSLARPAADGSTWVTSAWSTDRYTPNPRPMIAAEAMATGQDGHSASMTAGTAMTRPETVTGSLRRPVRSETTAGHRGQDDRDRVDEDEGTSRPSSAFWPGNS